MKHSVLFQVFAFVTVNSNGEKQTQTFFCYLGVCMSFKQDSDAVNVSEEQVS